MKKQEEIAKEFTINMLNEGSDSGFLIDTSPLEVPKEETISPIYWQPPETMTLQQLQEKNDLTRLFDKHKMHGYCYIRPDYEYLNLVLDKINDYMRNYGSNLKDNANRKSVIKAMTLAIYQYADWPPKEVSRFHQEIIQCNGFLRSEHFPKLEQMVTNRFPRHQIDDLCLSFSKVCEKLEQCKDKITPSTVGWIKSYIGYQSCNLAGLLEEIINEKEMAKYASNLRGFICDDEIDRQLPGRRAFSDTVYKRSSSLF